MYCTSHMLAWCAIHIWLHIERYYSDLSVFVSRSSSSSQSPIPTWTLTEKMQSICGFRCSMMRPFPSVITRTAPLRSMLFLLLRSDELSMWHARWAGHARVLIYSSQGAKRSRTSASAAQVYWVTFCTHAYVTNDPYRLLHDEPLKWASLQFPCRWSAILSVAVPVVGHAVVAAGEPVNTHVYITNALMFQIPNNICYHV